MKKLFKAILIGTGLAGALTPQVAKSIETHVAVERQVINQIKPNVRAHTFQIGGLPLITEYYGKPFGMTPKEYGIRFGNGKSRKVKANRKHRSHQTILSHRKAK